MAININDSEARIAKVKEAIALQKARLSSRDPSEKAGAKKHLSILRVILVIAEKSPTGYRDAACWRGSRLCEVGCANNALDESVSSQKQSLM